MKIVVASDKWKGSLTAPEACAAMAAGLRTVFPEAEIVERPIADGGDGTAAAVFRACGGKWLTAVVSGPFGQPVEAGYALLPDGTAVIEMAAAAGIVLAGGRLDPWQATTRGVGELMRHAAEAGAARVIVGLGGSATNDAGVGMARALGWTFAGSSNWPRDGAALTAVERPRPGWTLETLAACDVTNPLLGERGCTRVFGPQKGVQEVDFPVFDAALGRLASFFPDELSEVPGAGAAGGLGFGLLAFCGAKIVSGFGIVAELMHLEREIEGADLVVTGEGSLDAQTLDGKGPHGVARLARQAGKRVVGIGGRVTDEARPAFDLTLAATPAGLPLPEAMARAAELVQAAVTSAAEALRTR